MITGTIATVFLHVLISLFLYREFSARYRPFFFSICLLLRRNNVFLQMLKIISSFQIVLCDNVFLLWSENLEKSMNMSVNLNYRVCCVV